METLTVQIDNSSKEIQISPFNLNFEIEIGQAAEGKELTIINSRSQVIIS